MASPGQFLVDGSTGDVLTIPAPSGPAAYIEVTDLQLTVSATSTLTIKSGSVVIDKAYLGTGNRYERGPNRGGILKCDPGQDLVINNSAGTIAGAGTYTVRGAG